MLSSTKKQILTITPNNPDAVPTERYVRLIVILTVLLLLLLLSYLGMRLLSLIHHTALLFCLGGLLAYALDPIVEWVRGSPTTEKPSGRMARQRPRWLGVVAVFAVVTIVFGLGTFFLGRVTFHQVAALVRDHEKIRTSAVQKLDEADRYLARRGIRIDLTEKLKHPPTNVKKWGEDAARGGLDVASAVSRGAVEGAVVVLIAVYFLLFSEELHGMMTRLFPSNVRPYILQWQSDVNRILGGFVRGQAILAIVLGVAAAAGCGLLGLRFWLLIGAFVVLASLIPVIGPYIGAIPAMLSAVLTPEKGFLTIGVRAALVAVLFIIINEGGSKILYPRLVGKALGLHEFLVLFALLAGFEVGGIVGVLFAAPLTALALVTIKQIYLMWLAEPPAPTSSNDAGDKVAEAG